MRLSGYAIFLLSITVLAMSSTKSMAANNFLTNLWKPEVTAVVRSSVVEKAVTKIASKFFLPGAPPLNHPDWYIQTDAETRLNSFPVPGCGKPAIFRN